VGAWRRALVFRGNTPPATCAAVAVVDHRTECEIEEPRRCRVPAAAPAFLASIIALRPGWRRPFSGRKN